MDITETLYAENRAVWRAWLEAHHATAKEIWLITYGRKATVRSVSYLEAVLEALCFGWIDGIAKKLDAERTAQRFTPRRPKSNWTELNKERARRLIADGLMTEAGRAVLPDLTLTPLDIAPDILQALQADPQTWANFQSFPDLYQRIRIGAIEEQRRNPDEFRRRLKRLVEMTAQNKMFRILE